jgi:hypothetical protein
MKPATRLEHEQKSGVIPVDFIFSEALTAGIDTILKIKFSA